MYHETKEKKDKLAEELKALSAAHDPLKKRLTEANRKSRAISQDITKTVMLLAGLSDLKYMLQLDKFVIFLYLRLYCFAARKENMIKICKNSRRH